MRFMAGTGAKLGIAIIGALASGYSAAGLVSTSGIFETSGQSMWGTGNAVIFDFNECLCTSWNSSTSTPFVEDSSGLFTRSSGRARLTLGTSGRTGLELDLSFDSGSVNARSAFSARFDTPDAQRVGERYRLSSVSSVSDTSFSTNFPELQAYADVVLDANFNVNVNGRIDPPGRNNTRNFSRDVLNVDIDPRLELVGLNRDGDGELRVLDALTGGLPGGFQFGQPQTIQVNGSEVANVTVYLPDIDTESGLGGSRATASGAADLLGANLDLDGILTSNLAVFGVPPFEQSFDIANFRLGPAELVPTFSYNLLDIEVGPVLELTQDFTLDAQLRTSLTFDREVTVTEYSHFAAYNENGTAAADGWRVRNASLVSSTGGVFGSLDALRELAVLSATRFDSCQPTSGFRVISSAGGNSTSLSASGAPAVTLELRSSRGNTFRATVPQSSGCTITTTTTRDLRTTQIAAEDFADDLDFVYEGEAVNATATHELAARFGNDTALEIDFQSMVSALTASLGLEVRIDNAPDLDFGTLSGGPVFSQTSRTDLAGLGSVFNDSFLLGGFERFTTSFALFGAGGMPMAVPAPPSALLLSGGLLCLFWLRRRHRLASSRAGGLC